MASGDDDSDFASQPSDVSSSSVCEDCDDASSSSVTPKSSDSETSVSSSSLNRINLDIEYGELVDDRDGQTYKTVKIGNQVWMAENLNFKADSSYCYNDSAEYCGKYGRLYKWAAAVGKSESECGYGRRCSLPENIQGVCPSGWHLPSKTEWEPLFAAIGGRSVASKVLKSISGWYDNGNGTDDFGFSVLPAGFAQGDGNYSNEGSDAIFWCSTEYDMYYAYHMLLLSSKDEATQDYYKIGGFSVYNGAVVVRTLTAFRETKFN